MPCCTTIASRLKLGLLVHRPARRCCSPACRPTSTCPRGLQFSGNIFGSTFFMATGFHGFHVIIGTIFLLVCLMRVYRGPVHAAAASRLRVRGLVLALRRRGLAVPVRRIYVWGSWGAAMEACASLARLRRSILRSNGKAGDPVCAFCLPGPCPDPGSRARDAISTTTIRLSIRHGRQDIAGRCPRCGVGQGCSKGSWQRSRRSMRRLRARPRSLRRCGRRPGRVRHA